MGKQSAMLGSERYQRLKEENEFIKKVMMFIPLQYKSGYDLEKEDEETPETKHVPAIINRANGVKELQERLQAKLAALRGKNANLKAKKRLRHRLNQVDVRKRKLDEKLVKRGLKGLQPQNEGLQQLVPGLQPRGIKPQSLSGPASGGAPSMQTKPVFNKDGKMVFSKFDFTSEIVPEKRKKEKKDYKKLLVKAKEREREGKQSETVREKGAWKTALQKSAGVKVKDDPELLKRTMKKREQKKKQSKKKWKERQEQMNARMEAKQKKRNLNIESRKKERDKKKKKALVKKGRLVPGF